MKAFIDKFSGSVKGRLAGKQNSGGRKACLRDAEDLSGGKTAPAKKRAAIRGEG